MKNFRTLEDFIKVTFLYEKEHATEAEYCEKDCERCKVEDCMYRDG